MSSSPFAEDQQLVGDAQQGAGAELAFAHTEALVGRHLPDGLAAGGVEAAEHETPEKCDGADDSKPIGRSRGWSRENQNKPSEEARR